MARDDSGQNGERDPRPDRRTGPGSEPDIRDLLATLRDLRDAVREDRPRRRGRRLPTPGDLLRLTERRAIPALVAALEAQIHALELLQDVIRIAEGHPPRRHARDRDDAGRDAPGTGERAGAVGRAALDRLDDVLADLERALTTGEPPDTEASELLGEARDLRADIEAQLSPSPDAGGREREEVPVDVEAELDSIKRELDSDDGEAGSGSDGT